MYTINEIAPDVYRISVFVPEIQLQFNHFLIKDDEPMLYHAGMKHTFPILHEAVTTLIDPRLIRWIGFSHFEVDECGALNEWLEVAPHSQAVCSEVGAMVNISDFGIRPAKAMRTGDILETGKRKFRFIQTPHLPHGWDAGVMFEETDKTLLCSDLLHQNGNQPAITDKDILESHRTSLMFYEAGPLMDYTPYNHKTKKLLYALADLQPKTLATMHGSSFFGDCSKVLRDLDEVMKQVWGEKESASSELSVMG
jgi:flavorubredoxin